MPPNWPCASWTAPTDRSEASCAVAPRHSAAAALGMSLFLIPLGTEFLPERRGAGPNFERAGGWHAPDIVNEQALRIESIVYPAVPEAIPRRPAQARVEIVALDDPCPRRIASAPTPKFQRPPAPSAGSRYRAARPGPTGPVPQPIRRRRGHHRQIRGFDPIPSIYSRRAMEEMAEVPGVLDINSSIDEGIPQQELTVDRDKAADLGFSVSDVAQAIETAFAGTQAGEFRDAGNSHRILVQFRDAERLTIEEVLDLTLTSSAGERVALRNLVAAAEGRGPQVIQRKDQQRIATVSANVVDRDPARSRATDRALDLIARPAGYDLTVAGTTRSSRSHPNCSSP